MDKRLTRREFLRYAGLAGSVGFLAACAVPMAAPTTTEAPADTAEGPKLVSSGKLVVWDVPNSVADMPQKEAKEQAFREAYPEVDLQIDYFLGGSTDDFKMKAVTEMAAGIYPDAIYFQNSDDWIYRGILMPLDDYIDADPEVEWEDYLPIAQEAAMWQGKRYQLPVGVNAWSFYYNKEMLTEYGVKMPEEYLAEDRWTWDDGFLEICMACTKGEGVEKTWGVNLYTGGGYWGHDAMSNVLWSNDADFYRKGPWRCTLDEPQAIASLQYIVDLIHVHGVNPPPGSELPSNLDLDFAAFMRTGIWMLNSGAWRESFEKFGQERMGHIRNPYGWDTGYSSNQGGAGGGMTTPTRAERPETAWIWHKWNANEYVKTFISSFHQQAPAKKSLLTYQGYLDSFAPFENVDEWNYAIESGRRLLVPNNGSESINLMMAEWDRVKLQEITVEEYVDIVKPQVDELIAGSPE
jgi:multiple sugar transport system substrate-binding protein